jgi:hypothetical protein
MVAAGGKSLNFVFDDSQPFERLRTIRARTQNLTAETAGLPAALKGPE